MQGVPLSEWCKYVAKYPKQFKLAAQKALLSPACNQRRMFTLSVRHVRQVTDVHICPDCNKTLPTLQALNLHRHRVHDWLHPAYFVA
eukprot:6282910-Karenia_brevis.AAC.1